MVNNLMDNQWGMATETTYNTPVTVTRFYPWLDDVKSAFDTRRRDPAGIFAASNRTRRTDRSFLPIGQGSVTVKAEVASRQGALLLTAACGVGTLTLVSGATNQVNITGAITGVLLPSYTIQVVKIRNDGTPDAETYSGCTAMSAELECPEDGIMTITVVFDARAFSSAVGVAAFSVTSGAFLFDASQGVGGLGGTLTAPTATALATGLTVFGNWRSYKLAWDNTADNGRWVLGGRNQPTVGELKPVFSGSAEYNDTVLRAAFLAMTISPVTVTHATAEVLSVGFSTFQLCIPAVLWDSGFPDASETTVVQDVSGTVKYNGTLAPFFLVLRTADTVI